MKKLLHMRRLSSMGCYFILFQLIAQGFVVILIAVATHTTGPIGRDHPSWISQVLYSSLRVNLTGALSASALINADSARQQLKFVQHERSWLSLVYHDEVTPVLKRPHEIFNKSIPLAEFCEGKRKSNHDGGSDVQHAVFRNVMLVARQLLLPSTIDCNQIPRTLTLRTFYNVGRNSTPELEIRVVPNTDNFEDFEFAYSCHERVYEPSVLFSFINWPQHGHALFNGISLLWEAFQHFETGPLSLAGKNVRLYAYGDALRKDKRQEEQQYEPFFHMEHLDALMAMFTRQPVRSLASLFMQSDRHPICFTYLLAGIAGELDHYNNNASLWKWRDFARAIREHFGVPDPPRLSQSAPPLQRVARGVMEDEWVRNDIPKLGEIRPVDWKVLVGRPRLMILDRRDNRRILNAKELLQIAKTTSHFKSADIVYLEDLALNEQIRLIGETDMLFGMDGTGLMNGIFMPEGGIVVHVRPYGCAEFLTAKGTNFDRLFSANPGRVIRYESSDKNSTVVPLNIKEREELVFNHNSTDAYRFPFILRQDSKIDPAAFRCILDSGAKLLHGVSVDWTEHNLCTRTVFV